MFPACDNMLKAASFGKHIFVQNDTCDADLSCTFLPQWHHHGQANWSVFECASQNEATITITSPVLKYNSSFYLNIYYSCISLLIQQVGHDKIQQDSMIETRNEYDTVC